MEHKGDNSVTAVQAAERACRDAPHESSPYISPSVFSLDVGYTSQDVIRGEDPWIDLFAVIPSGLDALRID
jgi:hypothetical protein